MPHLTSRTLLRSCAPTLLLAVLLSGCLPSCERSRDLTLRPQDSLSRQVAETLPIDTLDLVWATGGTDEAPMIRPRTVAFGEGETLYATDAEADRLYRLDAATGNVQEVVEHEAVTVPYLAGTRGDTALVYSPETADVFFFTPDGGLVRTLSTPAPAHGALAYALATDDALYVKQSGGAETDTSFVARLDEATGEPVEVVPLPGEPWRRAGFLRAWGDTLVSLSGFLPVIDVRVPGGAFDSLRLQGFDSPMLPRTRRFLMGDVNRPPLLNASAAAADDLLFVLNMRPGWLRVDVFDRQGQLRYRTVQRDPSAMKEFYPTDLAVRRAGPSAYELAVTVTQPEPQVRLYRFDVPARPTPEGLAVAE